MTEPITDDALAELERLWVRLYDAFPALLARLARLRNAEAEVAEERRVASIFLRQRDEATAKASSDLRAHRANVRALVDESALEIAKLRAEVDRWRACFDAAAGGKP